MAEAAAQPAAAPPAAARGDPRAARGAAVPRAPGRPGPRRRARHRHVGQHGRHGRRARTASRRPRRPRSRPCATCRPAARSASSPPTGAPGSWSTRRPTSGASARRSTASRRRAAHGDLGDALELAGKLAARSGDAQILVATDGALATPADAPRSRRRITVLPVGRERKNQAIVALAVRTAPSAVTRSVFVSVANLDLERAARRLEVWGDGGADRGPRPPARAQARSDVVIDDVPARRRDARGPARRRRTRRSTGAPGPAGRRRPRLGDRPARPARD